MMKLIEMAREHEFMKAFLCRLVGEWAGGRQQELRIARAMKNNAGHYSYITGARPI